MDNLIPRSGTAPLHMHGQGSCLSQCTHRLKACARAGFARDPMQALPLDRLTGLRVPCTMAILGYLPTMKEVPDAR